LAEQHLGRFFDVCWRVQGTLKRGGNLNTPDFFLDKTGVKEYNYSASLGIERKRFGAEAYFSGFNAVNGIFSGAHIGNSTDLERIITTGETLTSDTFSYAIGRPRQTVHHSLLSARVWYAVPGLGTFTARLGSQLNQRQEFDRDRPYSDSLAALDQPELELKLKTRTADVLYESGAFKGYTLLSGATIFVQDNQYAGIRFFVPNYRLENLGMFVLGRKRMNKLELELGLRYDYRRQQVYRNTNGSVVRDDYDFRFPNFSLGAIWRPDSSQQLKFQVGSARRAPSINEWFSNGLHHGTATFETGDPSLGLEKAWSASMSWKRTGKNASAELSAYALFVDDYIYLVPSDQPVLTLSGAFPAFRYTGVDARMAGADASIEWQITSAIQAAFSGNLVLAENVSENEPLELMPAPRVGTKLQYVFRDAGRWSGRNLQVSYRRVFRQDRIPQSTADAPAPDAYGLTDIAIEGTINASKSAVWLSLGIDNLFNVRYRDYLNRLRYYSDEMGRNFMLRMRIPLNFNTRAHDHQH
jgi:iron complex outermembrane receptor protein